MRNGSSDNKLYFRSERFIRVNHSYYFQCREGQDQGPFADLQTAKLMLSRFLVAQQLRKPAAKKVQSVEATPTTTPLPVEKKPKKVKSGRAQTTQPRKQRAQKRSAPVSPPQKKPAIKQAAPQRPKPKIKVSFRKQPVEEYRLGATIGELHVQPAGTPVEFLVKDARFEVQTGVLKLRKNEYFDYAADSPVRVEIEVRGPRGVSIQKILTIDISPITLPKCIWP